MTRENACTVLGALYLQQSVFVLPARPDVERYELRSEHDRDRARALEIFESEAFSRDSQPVVEHPRLHALEDSA